ncbi:type I polyketide synthase [Actinomadura rayongensis]|uniref:SDR family NAD(P)-dependent oxidoreductase n=1 Tax=Actinomadura rayongensis TaxID=1429076 RepID=A0A6I4WJR8_9ACTN|nr:SDR family NAD(P)-dependent oxidoreductase [Actinomadura rayongensis]
MIGLSCRFPQAPGPDAFWRLLRAGTDAITDVPGDRPGTGRGGFLDQVDGFDAAFFGVSPREAAAMDPQQRLMLELAWEALEDARIVPAALAGSAAAVFAGATAGDYASVVHGEITPHTATGLNRGVIANRVSYSLGLRGPSFTVDAAQASSLVAVRLACESVRRGEAPIAIAGGVHLNLAPESTEGMAKFGALSPDGRCYTFDARANGYVRGEGGGAVVLKPLDEAVADGDRIYCVIRGGAVNNDGETSALTVPDADAQRDVIRLACADAATTPNEIRYVELHGTGTRRGDPVEAAALGAALGAGRDAPLPVGSVKTNIGHLEGAAGIAGLLKTALALHHGELPPSLNHVTPHPDIPLGELNLRVNTELSPWDGPRVAGVSAFGMGGTNCHLVLAEAPPAQHREPEPSRGPWAWPVSARDPEALRAQAAALHERLRDADADPADVAHALATTRTQFEHRAVIVADEPAALLDGLEKLAAGEPSPSVMTGFADAEAASSPFPEAPDLTAIAALHVQGHAIDWQAVIDRPDPRPVDLPTYAFQRERHWPVTETTTDDAIAIVGMACRYPGGATTPEALWDLVAAGADAIGPPPEGRGWNLAGLDLGAYGGEGGYLYDAGDFDPEPFGISPREALAMDPQQRLLLETAWETFERAGVDPDALRGTDTGVFTGMMAQDYGPRMHESSPATGGYVLTGSSASVASGRLAYAFGLVGPTMTIDTACSSSLVALHLAAQALRGGECSLALAGGVTVMASPGLLVEFSRQRGLSPDGRCRAFADGADGTGFSEGAGLLLLERLSDARRNGRRVLAILRGSAVNSDGASNGLTAPNGSSQQRVIRRALADAGLAPSDVDAVEAHGTGTTLGDPIEANALLATYGQDRETPLLLGSVKSNIGHTQAAAGAAGVIKMVQAMRHGVLPRTLHVDRPSERVDWTGGAVRLLTEDTAWPETGRARRAAVSSFGISGTNAHVILEQPAPDEEIVRDAGPVPWLLSARTDAALRAQARSLGDVTADPADVAVTLRRRAALDHRAVIIGETPAEFRAALDAFATGGPAVRGIAGHVGRTAFVFPGQGPQWAGMGAGLLAESEEFAASVDETERVFARYVDWSLTDVLRTGDSLDRVEIVQPALFAMMVALARVWRAHGVTPGAVLGHSQGEIAAAHVAGALDLDDAARIVLRRSALIADRLAGAGGMAWLALPSAEAAELLRDTGTGGAVSVAARNGPHATVVAGEAGALAAVVAACEERGIQARTIPVDYASHTPHVEAIRDDLPAALDGLAPRTSEVPFFSTVTGGPFDTAGADAAYWYRNLRSPVLFEDAVRALLDAGFTTFIEVSPHAVLTGAIEDTGPDATVFGTLRRDEGGRRRLLTALAHAHVAGLPVTWPDVAGRFVDLPTYPFQRQHFWMNTPAPGQAPDAHALLDTGVEVAGSGAMVFSGTVSLDTHPWLADHAVRGTVLLPGTGLLDLALHAGAHAGAERVDELVLETPLVLPADGTAQLQVTVAEPDDEGGRALAVHSRRDGAWTRHGSGRLVPTAPSEGETAAWPPPGAAPIDLDGCYDALAATGYEYGPAFQALEAAWRRGDEVFAQVRLPAGQQRDADRFALHPVLLDAALHAVLVSGAGDGTRLPFAWHDVRLAATAADLLRVRITLSGPDALAIEATDGTGRPVVSVGSLTLRPVDPDGLAGGTDDSLYVVDWRQIEPPPVDGPPDWPVLDGEPLDPVPATVLLRCEGRDVHEGTNAVLDVLRTWLTDDRYEQSTLVVQTRSATGPAPEDLTGAAVWGLVRSAQTEHPGRFVLVDADGDVTPEQVAGAVATGEPQLAFRSGVLTVPRLVRGRPEGTARPIDPDGTVLVTGGTGGLGALIARHLADAHGVRHLVLASRTGADAPGADELRRDLEALGATVTLAACDAADRDGLAALLAAIPADRPLTAVVHAAGVLADAPVESLTARQLDDVLRPKADAARNLHELTAGHDLAAFVLFSSIAATVGTAGQAGYAAANAYLDALAARRHAAGLPATAIAWGLWEAGTGMTSHLDRTDVRRLARAGIGRFDTPHGLALFDAAVGGDLPVLVAARLTLREVRTETSHAILRVLRRPRTRRAARGAEPGPRRAAAPGVLAARDPASVQALVNGQIADVLGYGGADAVDGRRPFKDLGIDSLSAVELRNRLAAATGLRLPSTVVFDHPSPGALADFLVARLTDSAPLPAAPRTAPAVDDDPVAIVGMACRFPGGVDGPDALWAVVRDGADVISGFPEDRGWDLAALYDPNPEKPGTCYARDGGFLDAAADFDADLFGISPREALAMDPQQRLLLETAYEAFEHAGIPVDALRGSDTGVFTGVRYSDYPALLQASADDVDGHVGLGNAVSVASGRIAYTFGLVGPAVTVDTACSSALVALHVAAQSLRRGECSLALAGAATVMPTPELLIEFARQRGLSPDGRCKAFSDDADGTGFSEGVGVLLVERLSDALRNGHRVHAVLRGSAVNQDGASNGLTAPNGPSQESVIRSALADAGLSPSDIDAVEAHGTGTPLGDPIEAQALIATYGHDRANPLWLGSIKSNIGHTQAAAGIAGIIKTVHAMKHGVLPRTLHVARPTARVDWPDDAVRLLTENTPWPETGRPRRAAISAFGISGTNAHVILEQPPAAPDAEPGTATPPWVLSAATEAALRAQAARLSAFAAERDPRPADVARTLLHGRAAREHRAVVLGDAPDEFRSGLDALARGEAAPNVVVGGPVREAPRPVLVFPGQGPQWIGMGAELLAESEEFAASIAAIEAAFARHVDWSLAEVLRTGDGLDRVDVVQPALFAMMVALARLWEASGVTPAAVVGHSQGEIAAAHVAGALTLDEAAAVVLLRSRVIATELTGTGGMASVARPAPDVAADLARHGGDLAVAAFNGPASTVVAGDPDALTELLASYEAAGVRATRIPVDYASHVPAVERVEEPLRAALAGIEARPAELPFYSTVTGGRLDEPAFDTGYWYRNLRSPVLFENAVRALIAAGHTTFVEVSPHAVLTGAIQDIDPGVTAFGTLRRDQGGPRQFRTALAHAHVAGLPVAWPAGGAGVELPTYAFQHRRYWPSAAPPRADARGLGLTPGAHPILSAQLTLADGDGLALTGTMAPGTHPWLADHAVGTTTLASGTTFVEFALHAAEQAFAAAVDELTLHVPLVLGAEPVALQVLVGDADETGTRSLTVHSRPAGGSGAWTRHAEGVLSSVHRVPGAPLDAVWPPPGAAPLPVDGVYPALAERGYHYGPVFRGLRAAWRDADHHYAEVVLDESVDVAGFCLHPALLDAALHVLAIDDPEDGVRLPFSWSGIRIHATGATALRVRISRTSDEAVALDLFDAAGAPVASIGELRMRSADPDLLARRADDDALYRLQWTPVALPADPPPLTSAVILGADDLDALGPDVPDAVIYDVAAEDEVVAGAHRTALRVLTVLQRWLADERFAASRLVVRTAHASLAAGVAPGLLRSAQAEHPGRFVLLDVDAPPDDLAALLALDEPEIVVRAGAASVPRLVRATADGPGPLPETPGWRLEPAADGALDGLAFAPTAEADRPLAPGEVRVAVRAAGLNFRDVLIGLGRHPRVPMGSEAAGIVLDTAPDVTDLAPGDRVFGLFSGGIADIAVTDRYVLAVIPDEWSFTEAAAVPMAYLSAWYCLDDLAGLRPGDSVLVHAGAGGFGMAAVQLARHRGLDVYATASPGKWDTLRALGVPDDHIASSRTLDFAERFAGRGMDAVLNSLTGEFLDRSLDLLAPGGRFIELGKADVRDPADLRPDIVYRTLALADAGPERIQHLFAGILALFADGTLPPMPVKVWDVRRAHEAFRYFAQGRNIGKLALTVPSRPGPAGTALITGATGALGSLVARHLAGRPGASHLLLVSRQGRDAATAAELEADLTARGATVTFAACDAADRDELAAALAAVPPDEPLTTVVHAAGVVDDAMLTALTPAQLDTVLRPKVDAAWNLHELTAGCELSEFVLFSSLAGTVGGLGQANYGAANAFVDALAAHRHARGLPAASLGWGLWGVRSAMTGHLGELDLGRLGRSGLRPMSADEGLALLDAALGRGLPQVFPARLDLTALDRVPAVLRNLAGAGARRIAAGVAGEADLRQRLVALPPGERSRLLLDLVLRHTATALGHAAGELADGDRAFKELGIDSLTAVEVRNLLNASTGLRLPATLVFDHPTPAALADRLRAELAPGDDGGTAAEVDRIEAALAALAPGADEVDLVTARLDALLRAWRDRHAGTDARPKRDFSEATDDELFEALDNGLS